MNQELKQRLIGAVVITALAAIFVPMLFDEPVSDPPVNQADTTIPGPPSVQEKAPVSTDEVVNSEQMAAGEEPAMPAEDMGMDEDRAEPNATVAESNEYNVIEEEVQDNPALADDANEPAVTGADSNAKQGTEPPKAVPAQETPVDDRLPLTDEPATIQKPTHPPDEATAKPAAPKRQATADLSRWYLQAGTFGRRENADALFSRLKSLGMPVTMQTVKGNSGPLYRIKIGPELNKTRALEMKSLLQKQKIKTILVGEGKG
jgi:DedD protein